DYDDVGNVLATRRMGCVDGCSDAADETIIAKSEFELPADDVSGWHWREVHSFVTGSKHTERRHELRHTYDPTGKLLQTGAKLTGTLRLDRFHETGAAVAPDPPHASAGIDSPVDVVLATNTYDDFGRVKGVRGPNGRCSSGETDPAFAQLPVIARVQVGALGD